MNHTLAGQHRRIDTKDVLAYKSRQDKKRSAAIGEIFRKNLICFEMITRC